ncbi:MAG: hypothetical protein ACRDLB_06985 [Actinomycetota bacterium]
MPRSLLLVVLALLCSACYGDDSNLTESGKGKPVVSATFPATAASGSVQELRVEVENPGPGEIDVLAIAFVLIGPRPGQSDFPAPLVMVGTDRSTPSIVSVEPSPNGISEDAAVYTFDGLAEGATSSFLFEVKVPDEPGPAANSVQVYDGREIDRAAGVRVETTVER